LDSRTLVHLVPDIASRDLYVCGPDGFGEGVIRAARRLGISPDLIHQEAFAF
jgi:ferredoxin-NADP reductase